MRRDKRALIVRASDSGYTGFGFMIRDSSRGADTGGFLYVHELMLSRSPTPFSYQVTAAVYQRERPISKVIHGQMLCQTQLQVRQERVRVDPEASL